jgi:hypothetical protein
LSIFFLIFYILISYIRWSWLYPPEVLPRGKPHYPPKEAHYPKGRGRKRGRSEETLSFIISNLRERPLRGIKKREIDPFGV